ncbi:MAG: MFS transporter [Candidatus Acidiferrum sp.]
MNSTRPRIFYGWWIVLVTAFCLFFSEPTVAVYSFSVFLKAVSQEFHAGRGAVSFAFTIHNLCMATLSPFVGRLIDRFGVRRVVLPGAILVGLVIVSAKWIGSSLSHYYLFYLALGSLSPATGVVPYSTVISRWFDRHRGLALGLMSFGSGIAAMVYPPMAQRLIALFGWRSAYAILGLAILIIPFFVLFLFLKEDPRREGLFPDGIAPADQRASSTRRIEGLAWSEIWITGTFWLLVAAFFLAGASAHACVLHLAAMLSDRGDTPQAAANATAVIGFAMLFGRTGSGYFLDRFFAPRVCMILFGQSALGIALLAAGAAGPLGILAGFMVGLAFGAEVEVIAFLVSRYFGLRSFGAAYGAGFASFALAGAFGAYTMGVGFDRTHSYSAPLVFFFCAMLVSAILFKRLGPYRFAVSSAPESPALASPLEDIS